MTSYKLVGWTHDFSRKFVLKLKFKVIFSSHDFKEVLEFSYKIKKLQYFSTQGDFAAQASTFG